MKRNHTEEGRLSVRGQGVGTITPDMVRRRAEELAIAKGRSKRKVLDSDMEEARRELTGRERLQPEQTLAEGLSEEQRWQPVPESSGHKVETVAASDEQTVAEELVEEGIQDAEHDQMIKATKQRLRRDSEG